MLDHHHPHKYTGLAYRRGFSRRRWTLVKTTFLRLCVNVLLKRYGPDFWMTHNIIIVTVNYRYNDNKDVWCIALKYETKSIKLSFLCRALIADCTILHFEEPWI